MKADPRLSTRALVVEDHKPFLDFVSAIASSCPNVEVIGRVQDGLTALQRAERLQPDVILLDIGLPGLNGMEVARRIGTVAPGAKIIFVTQESCAEVIEAAFQLGAWGYVMKIHAGVELPLALDAVVNGKKFFGNAVEQMAVGGSFLMY